MHVVEIFSPMLVPQSLSRCKCVKGGRSQNLFRFLISLGKVVVPSWGNSKHVLPIAPEFLREEWSRIHDRTFIPLSDCVDHDGHIFVRLFLSPLWVSD